MRYFSTIQTETNNKSLTGYLALLGSALAFSLMTVCVKKLEGRIPVYEIVFIRSLISIIITRLILLKANINPWGENKKLLILRGLLGSIALFCIFQALEILPLGIATIIQYTYPIFIGVGASLFLKEKLNRKIIYAIILGFIGVCLVLHPLWEPSINNEISLLPLMIALSGAIFTSSAYICVRKLSSSEHPLVIVYYLPLISIVLTIPFLFQEFTIANKIDSIWLILIGLLTQTGQIGITRGLKILPAAKAASINYSQVVFATLFGALLFSEPIDSWIFIGAFLILGATLISLKTYKGGKLIKS